MDYLWRAARAWKTLVLFFVYDIPAAAIGAVYRRAKGLLQRALDMFMLVFVMLLMLLVCALIIVALLAIIVMPSEAIDASVSYLYVAYEWVASLTADDAYRMLDWALFAAKRVYNLGWAGAMLALRVVLSAASVAYESALAAAENKSNAV